MRQHVWDLQQTDACRHAELLRPAGPCAWACAARCAVHLAGSAAVGACGAEQQLLHRHGAHAQAKALARGYLLHLWDLRVTPCDESFVHPESIKACLAPQQRAQTHPAKTCKSSSTCRCGAHKRCSAPLVNAPRHLRCGIRGLPHRRVGCNQGKEKCGGHLAHHYTMTLKAFLALNPTACPSKGTIMPAGTSFCVASGAHRADGPCL